MTKLTKAEEKKLLDDMIKASERNIPVFEKHYKNKTLYMGEKITKKGLDEAKEYLKKLKASRAKLK